MNFENKVDHVIKAFDGADDYYDPNAVLKSLLYAVFEQDYELAERAKQHHMILDIAISSTISEHIMSLKTESNNVWFNKEDGSKVRVICTDMESREPVVVLRTEVNFMGTQEFVDTLTMKELQEKYTQEP